MNRQFLVLTPIVLLDCLATAPELNSRDGAIIFSDLIGKLDVLRIECASSAIERAKPAETVTEH